LQEYATAFPLVTVEDFVQSQFLLLDHLGIGALHASVGSSLGGMQVSTSIMCDCLYIILLLYDTTLYFCMPLTILVSGRRRELPAPCAQVSCAKGLMSLIA
jgi:hypothetical protein